MATGLIALLDDVAALAKIAAATLDDAAGQAARAGVKAVGIVIDDAAVTPRYVVGFAAARELPIVWRIAKGSLRNKLLFLLPAALLLSLLAPWAITPLLMLGGAYLCFEGAEKLYEAISPHAAHALEAEAGLDSDDPAAAEEMRVQGAIRTDFILSAEIMALTLAGVAEASFLRQALILGIVGIGITVLVYGVVALIVKADDAGVALANRPPGSMFGAVLRPLGRGLVLGMPYLLRVLAAVGTAAMLWVGGGIILHGFEEFGLGALPHAIHDLAVLPGAGGVVEWLISATLSGLFGLVVGAATIPLVERVIVPLIRRFSGSRGRQGSAAETH